MLSPAHLADRLRRAAPALAAAAALAAAGCASVPLESARADFFAGQPRQADAKLAQLPDGDKDEVLYLMERGTIRQALERYEESDRDYLRAQHRAEMLEYYSLTKGAASFVINDRTLAFRGAPFERMLLHGFAAKNYLARGLWDGAAVEARNIIDRLEHLNGFPDDPYSRYLAAFCLEMQGASEEAAFQYRVLAGQVKDPPLDPTSGRLGAAQVQAATNTELVCFVGIGRAPAARWALNPNYRWGSAPYADIYAGDRFLGRSYTLSATAGLRADTERRLAAMKTVKTVARVAVKYTIAESLSRRNDALGLLAWVAMLAAEQPDTRRWETLPGWLQVARIPCPSDLAEFRVVFRASNGAALAQRTVRTPLARRGNVFVSVCRDAP